MIIITRFLNSNSAIFIKEVYPFQWSKGDLIIFEIKGDYKSRLSQKKGGGGNRIPEVKMVELPGERSAPLQKYRTIS